MSKNTLLPTPMEVSRLPEIPAPTFTRCLRREQAKRERRRLRVGGRTLIVGIDLAREREGTRYTPERTDPRDADLIALLFRRSSRPLTELQAYVAVMNSYLRTAHVLVTQRTFYRARIEPGETN